MKRTLLFIVMGGLITLGVMAQENLLKGGDFESQLDWDLVVLGVEESEVNLIFGNPMFAPEYGEGNNLRIFWDFDGYYEMWLYQTVYLKTGKTYEFTGAFKDVETNPKAAYYWHQIVIMPVDGFTDLSNGPDWDTYGSGSPILLSMGTGWGEDDGGGIGQDTTYTWCSRDYRGSFTGILDPAAGTGDTTIFTVNDPFPSATGGLALGDSTEFYFMLYLGQGASGKDNNFDFTVDEFSLHEYDDGTTGIFDGKDAGYNKFSIYPNPVRDILRVSNEIGLSAISMLNIVGQVVLRVDNIDHNTAEINTSGLENGLYIISVTDASGEISSRKLFKE